MEEKSADAKATPRQQARRLVLFIDGTWNVEDNNTNVWRLYSLCACDDSAEDEQICFYTKGVGTAYGSKYRGGVLGMGFTQILRQAYDWLIENYRKSDEIFIFGFSRGAYAARSLAGLIARCGVPTRGSPIGIDEIYNRYKDGDHNRTIYELLDAHAKGETDGFTLFEKWMIDHCVTADVKMVGVWDTVGSLIGPYGYLETGLRLPILNVFHAMAIDEHRFGFAPTLLTRNMRLDQPPAGRSIPRPIENVEQRWFAGAHANVGGGYPSDPLCQQPLAWIAGKAAALGLRLSSPIAQDESPWKYPVNNSLQEFAYGFYQLLTVGLPFYRKLGRADWIKGAVTTENFNETIDGSVFERWQRNKLYRPKNLETWAKRHNADLETLTTSVMAKDPTAQAPE